MKYSLGQLADFSENIDENNEKKYCEKIILPTDSIIDYPVAFSLSSDVTDKAVDYSFDKGVYFINFKIKLNSNCSINIKLKNKSGKDCQFIKQIKCLQNQELNSSIVVHAENNFELLVFEVERNNNADLSTKFTNIVVNLYSVNNQIANRSFKRIGLQADPGSIFVINEEEVRMGRTGMFEFSNDNIPIYNFSCIRASKGFILDYIEMSKEG